MVTIEEKGVLALGDSAMCESQVELFYVTTIEALQGYYNIPVKAELTGKAVFGIAGSQERGEIATAPS